MLRKFSNRPAADLVAASANGLNPGVAMSGRNYGNGSGRSSNGGGGGFGRTISGGDSVDLKRPAKATPPPPLNLGLADFNSEMCRTMLGLVLAVEETAGVRIRVPKPKPSAKWHYSPWTLYLRPYWPGAVQ
jgi:hypothetical protein